MNNYVKCHFDFPFQYFYESPFIYIITVNTLSYAQKDLKMVRRIVIAL